MLQTGLVYTDASSAPPLSGPALEGRRLWHTHNCQACHQLYGYGGFLGPDLTNAAGRLTPERVEQILTEGSGAMPAFEFEPDQREAVVAFLEAMDATGQGQARAAGGPDATWDTVAVAAAEEPGWPLFADSTCRGCHAPPGGRSPVGAPDLSASRLTRGELLEVLERGRPPLMPPASFEPREREQVANLLLWLRGQRGATPSADVWSELGELPWWDYR
jgi:mono/diheme cytochrome c family protein